MEFTVDADAAATIGTSGRDVYAGLQGDWGSVRLGSFNSVYKALSTGLEVFGDTTGDLTTYGLNEIDETSSTGLDDSNKLVGRFNMDAFSVWLVMETQSVKGTKSSANSETDTTHLGVSYKMANNTFALTYTDADNSEADYGATSRALGVIHALSKNTAIKGVYTTGDNDRLASRFGSLSLPSTT